MNSTFFRLLGIQNSIRILKLELTTFLNLPSTIGEYSMIGSKIVDINKAEKYLVSEETEHIYFTQLFISEDGTLVTIANINNDVKVYCIFDDDVLNLIIKFLQPEEDDNGNSG